MTISAQIIADSISPEGNRLTTMQLRYPRFIHAEFMTHRVFSRNASSSRAIPVKKMIEDLRHDPAIPIYWGSNQPGMQAGDELHELAIRRCKEHWLRGMEEAIKTAECLISDGLHKQIANRVLEPWAHINVVVTATEWNNFFELRCHPDAQPEIRALANAMKLARMKSTPTVLQPGEWHLPYINVQTDDFLLEDQIKCSVARCARVSYLTHGGQIPDPKKDLQLYERLVGSRPIHASPAEHQATPDEREPSKLRPGWWHPDEHGNFVGWRQHRKILEKALA